jgi:hypothetical protein
MWAMTPGGTKLMWTRDQLMHLSNSPLSRSELTLPPELLFLEKGAPDQPGIAEDDSQEDEEAHNGSDDGVFAMDS